MSFRRKLIVLMVVVAVVPVTILGVLSLSFTEKEVASRIQADQRKTATLTAATVERFRQGVLRSLQQSVDMIPFEDFPADKLGLALRIPHKQFPYLNIVALLDPTGRPLAPAVYQSVHVQTGSEQPRQTSTKADVAAFRKQVPLAAAVQRGAAFSKVYFHARSGKPRLAVALYFVRQKSRRMVLAAEVSLAPVGRLLRDLTAAGQSTAFLVDRDGRVLLGAGEHAPKAGRAGRGLEPVTRGLRSGRSTSGRFSVSGSAALLGSFAPVKRSGWGVVVAQPERTAYSTAERIRRYTAFWAALCLLLAVFAGVWFARSVSRPVRALAAAADQISQGNYDQTLDTPSSDEIGQLAKSFNAMAASVQQAVDTVTQQAEKLHESERHYRTLVETSPDAIVRCDATGRILRANAQTAVLLGRKPGQLRGRRLTNLIDLSPVDGGEPADFVSQPTRELSFAFQRDRDRPAIGALSSTPVHSDDGALIGCVAILRDVTEVRSLQTRLAQADRLASVGMLAAGVAHEINNPLTYVLGNLQILQADLQSAEKAGTHSTTGLSGPQEGGPPEESAEALLHDALEGAIRIRDIVANLRMFSRAESTEDQPIYLNEVVQSALRMAKNHIRHRARTVTDLGEVPAVMANTGKLSQVFLNLLVNAAQAIPEGDAEHNEVRVKTWSEGDRVFGEVSDTGEGIPPELLSRVFDPFFTTKAQGEGSGLGLAICHGIVSEYGGRIDVHSTPGESTRIVVSLPRHESQDVPETPAAAVREAEPASPRARLLVVDDEPSVCRLAERMLRTVHDVEVVHSGAEAIERLRADDPFDLILCDLHMPQVTGQDLYQWCQKERPGLAKRMLFMTGGTFHREVMEFLKSTPFPRLEKPFKTDGLRSAIRDALEALERSGQKTTTPGPQRRPEGVHP